MAIRLIALICFFASSLVAMAPAEKPTPQKDEESEQWAHVSPSKKALLHLARALAHRRDRDAALLDRRKQEASRAKRKEALRYEYAERSLEEAAAQTVSEPEKASRMNETAAGIFVAFIKDHEPLKAYNPESPADVIDLHKAMLAILKNSEASLRRPLLDTMCKHVAYGETPVQFIPWAVSVAHIVDGNATGGGHLLSNDDALTAFQTETALEGACVEECAHCQVLHGVRGGVGKTIFPFGTTQLGVVSGILSILNDRNCVVMQKKIDSEGDRWSVLGFSPFWDFPVEIKVDKASRVVETAYPIFSFVDPYNEHKKHVTVLRMVDRTDPDHPREIRVKKTRDELCAIAQNLIAQYRTQQVSGGAASSTALVLDENPVQYRDGDYVIVDIAPALVQEGLTYINHGIYVYFNKSDLKLFEAEASHS